MDLKAWMKENRWSSVAMAKEIGVSNSTLSNVRAKIYKPSLLLAKAIYHFTDGAVTLSDLGISDNKVRVKKYRVKKLCMINENLFSKIADEVESDQGWGGLSGSGNMYYEYAKEITLRYIKTLEEDRHLTIDAADGEGR